MALTQPIHPRKLKAYKAHQLELKTFLTSKVPVVLDIETNGLLDVVTKVHCVVTRDLARNNVESSTGLALRHGYQLSTVVAYVGHNLCDFDFPVMEKLLHSEEPETYWDTLVMSKLLYPDIFGATLKNPQWRARTPKALWVSHSLKAWGFRLGVHKGTYGEQDGAWEQLSPEMLDYCIQDTGVNMKLYKHLKTVMDKAPGYLNAYVLELEMAKAFRDQRDFGVKLDTKGALVLSAKLQDETDKLRTTLRGIFPSWQKLMKTYVAKVNRPKVGVVKGQIVRKYKTIDFNPGSTQQIAKVLTDTYGWQPKVFTETGLPSVTVEVLEDYTNLKGVPEIIQYLTANKILSYVSGGAKSWIKLVGDDGLLHGTVDGLGTFTRRASHNGPNLGQVPSNTAYLGKECRSLFSPPKDWEVMLGIDADQLELRTLAHYLHRYDGGTYCTAAIQGSKADGTDIHSINGAAMGVTRSDGKTPFYAYVYGSGDENLGRTLTHSWDTKANLKRGRSIRKKLEAGVVGIKQLKVDLLRTHSTRGFLIDLDGMPFDIRSDHSVLNMLNQRAGAILMKRALSIARHSLVYGSRFKANEDYAFMLNVHDEWQLAIRRKAHAKEIGKLLEEAFVLSGVFYNIRLPITGSYEIGGNWSETH